MTLPTLTFRASALGPLREVEWTIPPGVSVLVGPNRVGKSTLLRIPEVLRVAAAEGLGVAVRQLFGGVSNLRNWTLPPSATTRVGVSFDLIRWELDVDVRGGDVVASPREAFWMGDVMQFERSSGSNTVEFEGLSIRIGDEAVITKLISIRPAFFADLEAGTYDAENLNKYVHTDNAVLSRVIAGRDSGLSTFPIPANIIAMIITTTVMAKTRVYRAYDYEIKHLARYGSSQSPGRALLSSGENVFPLLRNWRDSQKNEDRYDFVLATMREVFPTLGRIGFEQAGQTVTMMVNDRRWAPDKYVSIASESTGFITLLLHLCALASADKGSLLTFDEIENSLHPRAIRILVEAMRRRAASHDLRIVLATQSETVLDQFRDEPDHVFVLEPNQDRSPKLLTELFSRDYLSQFSLGDLFAHLEFGADESSQA